MTARLSHVGFFAGLDWPLLDLSGLTASTAVVELDAILLYRPVVLGCEPPAAGSDQRVSGL